MNYSLFVSCPKGLEYLLEDELRCLGFLVSSVSPLGVYGKADLRVIYDICLWSRIANRVLLSLFSGFVDNEANLYKLCRDFSWHTVFTVDKTMNIEFHGMSESLRNTMFAAQVIKDAIVDYFRELTGIRPSIARNKAEITIQAYLKNNMLSVSLDLVGFSLHQRGYRLQVGLAPLKENLACAMLFRAKWPLLVEEGYALHDPLCGAGTIVIEAAMMALKIAPGLLREDQSLKNWQGHEADLWEKVRHVARLQQKTQVLSLKASDKDSQLIALAAANAERAGVLDFIEFTHASLIDARSKSSKGLLITNPPYGERLSEVEALVPLYKELGSVSREHYQGWQVAILTSNPLLAKATGLWSKKQYTLFNGAIKCKLYCFELGSCVTTEPRMQETEVISGTILIKEEPIPVLSTNAEMLANRLRKNHAYLQKWAKRNQISCYRVYDADLPEYAYAIDIYNEYAVLQEYAAPSIIPVEKVEKRSLEMLQVVPLALGISVNKLIVKLRIKQKGKQQYQKINQTAASIVVVEAAALFKVNLYDYLDTGLFLDNRLLRLKFSHLKPGVSFLNCFCYTASASVHAALAGAITTNVDLSNTYLTWAKENFRLNKLELSRHKFLQNDCTEWLKAAADRFDVIFLDPPSFSNSKKMRETFDLQRMHVALIDSAMRLLNPQGSLYFSTNFRHFKLSATIFEKYQVEDISSKTIDLDFKRNYRIHSCFIIKDRNYD